MPEEYEGEEYDTYYYFTISVNPCKAVIDDSSFIARILYPFFSVFEKIRDFFEEIMYKLGI